MPTLIRRTLSPLSARPSLRRVLSRSTWATLLEVLGAVLIGVGLHRIYPPLAWIFGGLFALLVAWALEAASSGTTPAARPDVDVGADDDDGLDDAVFMADRHAP
jgi:hypothetical protein